MGMVAGPVVTKSVVAVAVVAVPVAVPVIAVPVIAMPVVTVAMSVVVAVGEAMIVFSDQQPDHAARRATACRAHISSHLN
jgi:hypothetical protein